MDYRIGLIPHKELLAVFIAIFTIVGALQSQAQSLSLSQAEPQYGAPGSSISLYGAGFDAGAADHTVTFAPVGGGSGTDATPSALNGGKLTVTIPAGLAAGQYRISVTRASDGATSSLSRLFTSLSSDGGILVDISAGLTGVVNSSSDWGDYDGDGDMDLVITGYDDNSGSRLTTIYENKNGSFSAVGAGLTALRNGSSKWGDYDNDGDLDLILTGSNSSGTATSLIYRNDGSNTFTEISAGLTGVLNSSTDWGDYDGDGDLDLIITGSDDSFNAVTTLYENDGADGFTAVSGTGIDAVQDGSATWGDYDNDGELDLLITGLEPGDGGIFSSDTKVAKIYQNNGDDTFTSIGANLTGVQNGSGSWGDYDGDGDLDLVVTGSDYNLKETSIIYRNDGGGTFTNISAGLTGVINGTSSWGDFDGDGDLDLLITGQDGSANATAAIYRNDGNDTFTDINTGLTGVENGFSSWGDYNGDGILDLVISGRDGADNPSSTIYNNIPLLALNSMSPESGRPGDEITLNGAGFGSSTSGITVTFTPSGGGTGSDITPTTIYGGTQLTANVPEGLAVGDYTVSVTRDLDSSTETLASSFTVDPPSGDYTVTNTNDSGEGSLRAAIEAANSDGVESTIEFDISGTTPHTITLNSALPAVNNPLTIDGTSEPDYTDSPVIELDGQNTSNSHGFDINTSNSVIKGLSIVNFYIGINFYDTHSDNEHATIEKNYIGLRADGTTEAANTNRGIRVRAFEYCTIKDNVISGNNGEGIYARGDYRADDEILNLVISGNLIGTDASGTVAKGNGADGIRIIGPAMQDSIRNNVISGNAGSGIWMNGGTNITIQGNKVGTTGDGSSGLGNQGAGIVAESVVTLQIGGDATSERNIISDNAAAGIEIEGGESHTIQGNYIGLAADGSTALGNGHTSTGFPGILVEEGAADILIGGTNSGEGNVVAANGSGDVPSDDNAKPGIRIDGVLGDTENEISNVTIQGNMVGTTADGTAALGNYRSGINIDGVANTLLIDQNVISANGAGGDVGNGIYMTQVSEATEITGNKIGTDINGNNGLSNDGSGITLSIGVSHILIGGSDASDKNIISANNGNGIFIGGNAQGNNNNTIKGNNIGIGADGSTPLGNSRSGVFINMGNGNLIGGTSPGEGNIIAHNGIAGVGIAEDDYNSSDKKHFQNEIRRNRIFQNDLVGIELIRNGSSPPDSTTFNDSDDQDADTGPNNLQNYPEITDVEYKDSTEEMTVWYSVPTATSNATYPLTVEFFRSDDSHQAFSYLGSDQVSSGEALAAQTATFVVENPYSEQDYVVATVTDADGNTSEIGIIKQQSPSYTIPGDQEIKFSHEFGHPDVYTSFKFSSGVSHDVEYDGFTIEHHFSPEQNDMPTLPQNTELAMEGSWRYYYDNSNSHDGSICFNLNKLLDASQQLNSLIIYESTKLANSREDWKNIGSFVQNGPDGDSYVCGYVDHTTNANSASYYDYVVVNATSNLASISIPGPNEGWHMITSPAQNTTLNGLLGDFWTQGIPGSDAPGETATVYYWDETSRSFKLPGSMSDVMDSGQGYIAYIYDDQDHDGTAEGFPKSLTVTGDEHPASTSIPVTANDTGTNGIDGSEGWNLISNPFSVSAKVDEILDAARTVNANVNANIYVWDPNKAGGADYQILAEGDNEVIAPFQAFWIRYTQDGVSGNIAMDKSTVAGSGGSFYKEQQEASRIELTLHAGALSDQFILRFDGGEQAQPGLDLTDAYQLQPLNNEHVQLFTVLGEHHRIAVNRLPADIGEGVQLPLHVENSTAEKNMTLSWQQQNVLGELMVTLHDKHTGNKVRLGQQAEYSFSINHAKAVADSIEQGDELLPIQQATENGPSHEDTRFVLEVAPKQDGHSNLPESVELSQNYPNPFNPTTVISYAVPEQADVQLSVFNILGQRVSTLVNAPKSPGRYEVDFDATGLSSGLYFYRLRVGSEVLTNKMMFVK